MTLVLQLDRIRSNNGIPINTAIWLKAPGLSWFTASSSKIQDFKNFSHHNYFPDSYQIYCLNYLFEISLQTVHYFILIFGRWFPNNSLLTHPPCQLYSRVHQLPRFIILIDKYTVKTRKLWNRKTTLKQYLRCI